MQPVKFVVIYDTRKISYFLPKKDKIPNSSRSNIVYEVTCPGCNSSYIGKTERNLATRLSEHSDPQKSSISKHLSECEHANYILNLNHIMSLFCQIPPPVRVRVSLVEGMGGGFVPPNFWFWRDEYLIIPPFFRKFK